MKPYDQFDNLDGSFTRTFDPSVDEGELVWHRDRADREIKVVWNSGWQFQFDDELPVSINTVSTIPAMVYHRLIKGDGWLVLEIKE